MSAQNDLDYLKDKIQQGQLTAAQANVQKVRLKGVVVVHKLTREVRSALNAGVRAGELGHMKKNGAQPEMYYHPNSLQRAKEMRAEAQQNVVNALLRICV